MPKESTTCNYCNSNNPVSRNLCIKCLNPLNIYAEQLFPELIKKKIVESVS